MTTDRKILILGGLALAAFGMLYGLHYALFVEHQTLDGMGASLAGAFVQAAQHHASESTAALDQYTRTKYVYVRQVDVHSHWGGLAMLLIVLGMVFERVNLSQGIRTWIATALLIGSISFPLGVLLQTTMKGPFPSALAIVGSALVTVALLFSAWGFARQ